MDEELEGTMREPVAPDQAQDDDKPNALREFALDRMDNFWKRVLRLVAHYRGDKLMAFDAMLLALGEFDMLGMKSAVEVAVKHYGDASIKSTVSKAVKTFQDALGVEPMPGQRSNEGCLKMSESRKKQLKPKNT